MIVAPQRSRHHALADRRRVAQLLLQPLHRLRLDARKSPSAKAGLRSTSAQIAITWSTVGVSAENSTVDVSPPPPVPT